MNKYYTVNEYSQLKGVEPNTVRQWTKQHKLKIITIGQGHDTPQLVIEENIKAGPVVLSFMNLKGGCGKTTIACHAAALLSKLGYKVLLIDTDHQNQCEMFFPDNSYDYTLLDAFSGKVLMNDAIYETGTKTSLLDIVYSDFGFPIFLREYNKEERLEELLAPIKDSYDYIIIDTSPNFDLMNVNVAKVSTHIIIPITPVPMHIKGMGHNFEALEKVAKVDLKKIIGIIPNIVDKTAAQQKAYIKLLNDEYEGLMFESIIHQSKDLPKVADFNTNIFDFKEKSKPSQELKKFLWETLRRI